jgi:hypothetical protein
MLWSRRGEPGSCSASTSTAPRDPSPCRPGVEPRVEGFPQIGDVVRWLSSIEVGHPCAGGYPRIFDQKLDPSDWLGSYVATHIERDVRTISNVSDLVTFQRFVELSAGRTAQLLNYSSLASASRGHLRELGRLSNRHASSEPRRGRWSPVRGAREGAEQPRNPGNGTRGNEYRIGTLADSPVLDRSPLAH